MAGHGQPAFAKSASVQNQDIVPLRSPSSEQAFGRPGARGREGNDFAIVRCGEGGQSLVALAHQRSEGGGPGIGNLGCSGCPHFSADVSRKNK